MSSASAVAWTSSTAARHDAPVRVRRRSRRASPVAASASRRERMELVAGERDPRRRARAGTGRPSRPRACRAFDHGDLVLAERRSPVAGREVEPVARDDPALVHRVLARMAERDEPRSRSNSGVLEAGDQLDGLRARSSSAGVERLAERRDLGARGTSARSRRRGRMTGWIGRPPISSTIRLPAFLRAQPALDGGPVVAGQLEGARVAEEVGQRGAGRRGARGSRSTRRSRAAGGAPGPPGRSRRRTASSNAWTAVIWYATGQMPQIRATMSMTSSGVAADDQPLEVARRLEDLEARLLDLAVADLQAQRAFALDAGQSGDVDGRSPVGSGSVIGVMHRSAPRPCAVAARAGRHGRR